MYGLFFLFKITTIHRHTRNSYRISFRNSHKPAGQARSGPVVNLVQRIPILKVREQNFKLVGGATQCCQQSIRFLAIADLSIWPKLPQPSTLLVEDCTYGAL